MSALGQMFQGVEPTELLALARLACGVGVDVPQAPICESILALLDEQRGLQPPTTVGPLAAQAPVRGCCGGAGADTGRAVPGSLQLAGPRRTSQPASG